MQKVSPLNELSVTARAASRHADWQTVEDCAKRILKLDRDSAEGHFLRGLAEKGRSRTDAAEKLFRRALQLDANRYDAAIELTDQYVRSQRNSEAAELLEEFTPLLANSPLYLERAAQAYSRLDLQEQAWLLYKAASMLQPEIERFQTGLAACSVFLGKIDEAREIYLGLLRKHPSHQRFHFEISQLATASNFDHVQEMKSILDSVSLPPDRNIFLYYAIGKELEDLECWDEAFSFFERGGNAAKSVAGYQVETDITIIDTVIEVCNGEWLQKQTRPAAETATGPQPFFLVGLPRTGTTLVERIITSHSRVGSVGETFFLQLAIRKQSRVKTRDAMNPEVIRAAAAACEARDIAAEYIASVRYKIGVEPWFVEKLPENYLYLGFVASGFPAARILLMRRHPLDACFAMFKQSYFRYAYTLEDVGRYYVAYERLISHWRDVLGERLIEIQYETLVSNQEEETHRLLQRLGLAFEASCLDFQYSRVSSRTASAVQVRQQMHTRSVNRWRHFEKQLRQLATYLRTQGIDFED